MGELRKKPESGDWEKKTKFLYKKGTFWEKKQGSFPATPPPTTPPPVTPPATPPPATPPPIPLASPPPAEALGSISDGISPG